MFENLLFCRPDKQLSSCLPFLPHTTGTNNSKKKKKKITFCCCNNAFFPSRNNTLIALDSNFKGLISPSLKRGFRESQSILMWKSLQGFQCPAQIPQQLLPGGVQGLLEQCPAPSGEGRTFPKIKDHNFFHQPGGMPCCRRKSGLTSRVSPPAARLVVAILCCPAGVCHHLPE